MALVYQRTPGAQLRATRAGYFLVSSVVSLLSLAAFGQLGGRDTLSGLVLVPHSPPGWGSAAGPPGGSTPATPAGRS